MSLTMLFQFTSDNGKQQVAHRGRVAGSSWCSSRIKAASWFHREPVSRRSPQPLHSSQLGAAIASLVTAAEEEEEGALLSAPLRLA